MLAYPPKILYYRSMWISVQDHRVAHALTFNLQQHLTLVRGIEGANPILRSLFLFLAPIREYLAQPLFPLKPPPTLSQRSHQCIGELPFSSQATDPIPVSELVVQLLQDTLACHLLPQWQDAFTHQTDPDTSEGSDSVIQWQDTHFRYRLLLPALLPASLTITAIGKDCSLRYDSEQAGWTIRWGGHSLFYPGQEKFPWRSWLQDALQLWLQEWKIVLPPLHYIPADRASLGHYIFPKIHLFKLLFPKGGSSLPQVPAVITHFFSKLQDQATNPPQSSHAMGAELAFPIQGKLSWNKTGNKLYFNPDQGISQHPYQPFSLLPWDLYLLIHYCHQVIKPGELVMMEEPQQGCPPSLQPRLVQFLLKFSRRNPLIFSTNRSQGWYWIRQYLKEDRLDPSHVRVVTAGVSPAKRVWQPSPAKNGQGNLPLFTS